MPTLLPVPWLPVMLLTGPGAGQPGPWLPTSIRPAPRTASIAPSMSKPAALDLNADEQATLDNGGVVVRSKRTDLGGEESVSARSRCSFSTIPEPRAG